MARLTIIGAGAWGTALACVARRAGHDATIWAREDEVVDAINAGKGNPVYLPGFDLEDSIVATTDIAEAVKDADAVLMVAPSQFLRGVAASMKPHLAPGTPVILCAKGIEHDTLALMTEAAEETLPDSPIAVLSGPTFAREVAQGLPTAVTLACADTELGHKLVDMIGIPMFRPYLSDDPVGAEIGGAVKNVLAIACGIVTGKTLGDNTRAALITRGLAEMARLGAAKGGKPETLMGLSGLGDLTLTCNGPQSRNMSLGMALGEGRALDDILAERNSVAEGVFSAASVVALAKKLNVDMPICTAVDQVINHHADIDTTIAGLLSRPFRAESGDAN
jgi:glycerol-3-phosphate dehydrogenase (NAD(P)+)